MLKWLFGTGTRSVQTFNLCINTIWLSILALHLTGFILLDLPDILIKNVGVLILGSIIVNVLGFTSFLVTGFRHQLFKIGALLLNSLLQAIIATFYVTKYPPFEMIILVNVSFSIWFLLAVLYISKMEGLDGIK